MNLIKEDDFSQVDVLDKCQPKWKACKELKHKANKMKNDDNTYKEGYNLEMKYRSEC